MRRPTIAGVLLSALLGALLPAFAAAQTAPAPAPSVPARPAPALPPPPAASAGNIEIDPIRCWARTSAGGVRIGETFTVTLTCAVLESDAVQVVPDESKLGVTVMQMNPFEVVGGSHPADLRTNSRRFFQYDYNIRMINPDSIGQDVAVPLIQVTYRINSRIAGNQQMQGRELSYVLPVIWVKVLSIVPADATDIRDTGDTSFGRIEAIAFRAGVLEILAITLVVLGSIMTLLALIGIFRRSRKGLTTTQDKMLSRPALMRLAVRELAAAQSAGIATGWTDPVVNRAASALRLAAAVALDKPVTQRIVDSEADAGEGRFIVVQFPRGRRTAISASVTSEAVAGVLGRLKASAPPRRRQLLEELQATLMAMSVAQYGRPGGDRGSVDTVVNSALELARQMRSEHAWHREWLRRVVARTPLLQRQA